MKKVAAIVVGTIFALGTSVALGASEADAAANGTDGTDSICRILPKVCI